MTLIQYPVVSCSSAMIISMLYVVIILVELYIIITHGLKFPDYSHFLNSGNSNLYHLSKCLVNQP